MKQKDLLKKYLMNTAEPIPASQIAADTEIPKGSVGRLLGEFIQSGEVESLDDGHPSCRKLYCWSGNTTQSTTSPCCEAGAYHGMTDVNPDDAPEAEAMESAPTAAQKMPPEIESAPPTSRQRIASECDDIKTMLLEKNAAYGDSALSPMRVFSKASPEEQLLVRIDDKLSRIMRGSDAGEDTIADLIGYLILLKIQRGAM